MEYQEMPGATKAQREFIEQEQLHKKKVAVWRTMLLVLLLALWEFTVQSSLVFLENGTG